MRKQRLEITRRLFRSFKTYRRPVTEPSSLPRLSEKGWTLVELMIVTALIGIITPAMTLLFMKVSQGFAADEMHTQLKTLNEQTLLRIHDRLLGSRHMYQDDANHSGVSFIAAVSLTGTAPAVLAGSRPSDSQPSTIVSLSPNSGSLPASFGNSLFFAAYDTPQTVALAGGGATTFSAPITVSGANVTYSIYAGSLPATVIVDVYRFFYYYLTQTNAKKIPGVNTYNLIEWQSIQYADWYEINNTYTQDGGLGQAVVNYLTKTGPANFPGGPITMALDTSQVVPSTAFYQLANGSYPASPVANPVITQYTWTNLTRVSSGLLSNGFNYGISGNTANWGAAPLKVPLFTTAGTGVS